MSECLTKSDERTPREREHYGLAVLCAKRFAGRGVPREELLAEAEAALLWAASRFDPERGTRFSSYAIPFVLGALRDTCAKAAPMRVPRGERRLLNEADSFGERRMSETGHEPTLTELSAGLGITPSRLGAMLEARERMRAVEKGAEAGGQVFTHVESFEDEILLKDMISRLPKPCAQVIWLRFCVGYSQADVARRFGASQSWVSRAERVGKEMLKRQFRDGKA